MHVVRDLLAAVRRQAVQDDGAPDRAAAISASSTMKPANALPALGRLRLLAHAGPDVGVDDVRAPRPPRAATRTTRALPPARATSAGSGS